MIMTAREFKEHLATIKWAERMANDVKDETFRACWLDIAERHRELISLHEVPIASAISKY